MSFLNRVKQNEVDSALQGANAPKQDVARRSVFTPRNSGMIIPNNAPAQNYRASAVANFEQTELQAAYVNALRRNKIEGKKIGVASWIGKEFG